MRPTKEELLRALSVFDEWLKDEAVQAERNVAGSFTAGRTTIEQVAEQVGMARAFSGVSVILGNRIAELTE